MSPDPQADDRPAGFEPTRWKDPRWAAWAFRNTAQFMPVRKIAPSATPRALPRAELREPGRWGDFLQETFATSAVLVINDKVLAALPGSLSDPQPHMLFSVTKSVVGLVARLLIETGVVDERQTAAELLPDLAGTAFAGASWSELLAMRDGVPFDETYADPHADIHRYSRGYWGNASGGARAQLARLPSQPSQPGFAYRTPVADVIGAMLTASTGQSLATLVEELLWQPMGAANPAHFVCDTAGVEIAGAGLNATTADLLRLAMLLLDAGAWHGRQILPRHAVEALFAGGDADRITPALPGRSGWSYHDLWWHMGGCRIAALGVHGQRLIIDRSRRTVLLRTGAQPAPDNGSFDAAHTAMLDSITTSLCVT